MHTLIIGMTESGKSTLAKILARQLHTAKKKVAVLDPIYDPEWEIDFRAKDVDDFNAYLARERSVYAFVDESGSVFNDGNDMANSWWATRSRHYGHSFLFLAQRYTQIPKTVRDQCSRVYVFVQSVSDGKILADEWNKPILQTCNVLPPLEFFAADRYQKCDRMKIRGYREYVYVSGCDGHYDCNPRRVAHRSNRGRKMDCKS